MDMISEITLAVSASALFSIGISEAKIKLKSLAKEYSTDSSIK